jgi:hypothetical protein
MLLAAVLALASGQIVERAEQAFAFPLEGSVSLATGVAPGGASVGAAAHLGVVFGTAFAGTSGPVWSIGVDGGLARIPIRGCESPLHCATRAQLGATARVGWSWWPAHVQPGTRAVPRTSIYLQLAGGVAYENIESAPLAPGSSAAAPQARLSIGLTSLAFTQLFASRCVERATDWRFWLIALVPLALLNHLELGLGWAGSALAAPGPRLSLEVGFGF